MVEQNNKLYDLYFIKMGEQSHLSIIKEIKSFV